MKYKDCIVGTLYVLPIISLVTYGTYKTGGKLLLIILGASVFVGCLFLFGFGCERIIKCIKNRQIRG